MIRFQRGATLFITLIMLVVISLFLVNSLNTATTNLKVVGNMQARNFVDNVASQALEDVMNSIGPFNSPTGAVTVRSGGTTVSVPSSAPGVAPTFTALPSPAGVSVSISTRTCLFSAPAAGYSAVATITPEDNLWQFSVTVRDSFTQATTSITQGAKIRQSAQSCS